MKVKLTVELDLPADCEKMDYAELAQLIFDDYINYVTCSHLRDACHCCCDLTKKSLYEHHQLWGDICGKATWGFEKPKGADINAERARLLALKDQITDTNWNIK